jgi:putative spermidine/putrescine transport system substrate-binding protein
MSKMQTPRDRFRSARLLVVLALCALALGAGCGGDDDDENSAGGKGKLVINSYGGTWGEAIELGFIEEFERETGIEVELLSTADTAKSKLALETGNEPPEDIVDTGYANSIPLAEAGLLEPIPWDEFDPEVVDPLPESVKREYAAEWGGFAMGLCYDKRKFPDGGPQPSNWADYWDFEKFPGKRGHPLWVTGAAEPMPEFALLADGVAPEELYPIDAERAFAKMDELRPNVPKFAATPPELGQQLVDGTVVMELCFTHRVNKLIDGGADFIGISFDQARTQNDAFIVWKDAPNKENAMQFIEFILRKEQQARWARLGYTAPVHPDAGGELPEEVAARIATSPQNLPETFAKDEEYYADAQDGTTNQERLTEAFQEWIKG